MEATRFNNLKNKFNIIYDEYLALKIIAEKAPLNLELEDLQDKVLIVFHNTFDFIKESHDFIVDKKNDLSERTKAKELLIKLKDQFHEINPDPQISLTSLIKISNLIKEAFSREEAVKLKRASNAQSGYLDKMVWLGAQVGTALSPSSPTWEEDKFRSAIRFLQNCDLSFDEREPEKKDLSEEDFIDLGKKEPEELSKKILKKGYHITWHDDVESHDKTVKPKAEDDDMIIEWHDDGEVSSEEHEIPCNEKQVNQALKELQISLKDVFPSSYSQFNTIIQNLRHVLDLKDFQKLAKLKDPRAEKVLHLCQALFHLELMPLAKEVMREVMASGFDSLIKAPDSSLYPHEIALKDESKRCLKEHGKIDQAIQALSLGAQAALIDKANHQLKENRAVTFGRQMKAQFDTGRFLFDPILQTNLPFSLFSYLPMNDEGKPVLMLRLGTPTVGNKIAPEFRGLIQKTALDGKIHLYISLQSRKGQEGARNQALFDLYREFREAFKFVILDKNSHFYHQEGKEWEKEMPSREFKGKFFTKLNEGFLPFEAKSDFYFPEELKEKLAPRMKLLMKLTHQIFFPNKKVLTKEERKDFISLYYGLLELSLMQLIAPDTANITCKDAIDRAGEGNSILFQLLKIFEGDTESQEYKESLSALTHFPAFSAKKQGIIIKEGRRERLEGASRILKNPVVQTRIQKLREVLGFNPAATVKLNG